MKIYFDVIIVQMKKDAVYQKEMRLKFCFELLGFDTFKTVSVSKSFIMKKIASFKLVVIISLVE